MTQVGTTHRETTDSRNNLRQRELNKEGSHLGKEVLRWGFLDSPWTQAQKQGCFQEDRVGCFHYLPLVTRCFIEAASIDEILKVRLIQVFRIRHLRQDIYIVEAVPLPHSVHPRGVRLTETVRVVFAALLREGGDSRVGEVLLRRQGCDCELAVLPQHRQEMNRGSGGASQGSCALPNGNQQDGKKQKQGSSSAAGKHHGNEEN